MLFLIIFRHLCDLHSVVDSRHLCRGRTGVYNDIPMGICQCHWAYLLPSILLHSSPIHDHSLPLHRSGQFTPQLLLLPLKHANEVLQVPEVQFRCQMRNVCSAIIKMPKVSMFIVKSWIPRNLTFSSLKIACFNHNDSKSRFAIPA